MTSPTNKISGFTNFFQPLEKFDDEDCVIVNHYSNRQLFEIGEKIQASETTLNITIDSEILKNSTVQKVEKQTLPVILIVKGKKMMWVKKD